MHKRKLHHILTKLKSIRYVYLIAAILITGTVALFALRQNNLTALRLSENLAQVDKDNGNVSAALNKLRVYTYGHMNTNLSAASNVYPPIQLKSSYERLVAAEKSRVKQGSDNIYNDAQHYCEKNSPQSFYGAGRLPCVQQYLDSHPLTQPEVQKIPDSLYKFDFASPVWSPDLAGFSIVIVFFLILLLVIRVVLTWWLKSQLRRKLR
ncbi:MAG: hypothetical protein ABI354_01330 [Candidatus Saccharimonadales bacterium]